MRIPSFDGIFLPFFGFLPVLMDIWLPVLVMGLRSLRRTWSPGASLIALACFSSQRRVAFWGFSHPNGVSSHFPLLTFVGFETCLWSLGLLWWLCFLSQLFWDVSFWFPLVYLRIFPCLVRFSKIFLLIFSAFRIGATFSSFEVFLQRYLRSR